MAELRFRSHQWSDPSAQASSLRDLSGMDVFKAWAAGEFTPPMAATLGFDLSEFEEGRVVITCTPSEYHYNPYGMAHGGLAATLLDTATGCAIHTMLAAGIGYATSNLNISYVRPMSAATGEVRCVGEVVSMGKRVAVAEASIYDEADRLLAGGSATCLILRLGS